MRNSYWCRKSEDILHISRHVFPPLEKRLPSVLCVVIVACQFGEVLQLLHQTLCQLHLVLHQQVETPPETSGLAENSFLLFSSFLSRYRTIPAQLPRNDAGFGRPFSLRCGL